MCKALKDGGQRCAAHTRDKADKVIVKAVRQGVQYVTDEEFEDLIDYASTPSGRRQLDALGDLASIAQVPGSVHDEAFFHAAIRLGDQKREANIEFARQLAALRGETVDEGVLNQPAEEPWIPPVSAAQAPTAVPKWEPTIPHRERNPTSLSMMKGLAEVRPDLIFHGMPDEEGDVEAARRIGISIAKKAEALDQIEEWEIHDRLAEELGRRPTSGEYDMAYKIVTGSGTYVPDRYGKRPDPTENFNGAYGLTGRHALIASGSGITASDIDPRLSRGEVARLMRHLGDTVAVYEGDFASEETNLRNGYRSDARSGRAVLVATLAELGVSEQRRSEIVQRITRTAAEQFDPA